MRYTEISWILDGLWSKRYHKNVGWTIIIITTIHITLACRRSLWRASSCLSTSYLLCSVLFWPRQLLLLIIRPLSYFSRLPVALIYSSIYLISFVSPSNLPSHIFLPLTSFLNLSLSSLYLECLTSYPFSHNLKVPIFLMNLLVFNRLAIKDQNRQKPLSGI